MSTRKMTVTSCTVARSGTAASGREWTLYEVGARDEAGEPVDEQLKAFDPLPIGELIEYEIERNVHQTYGTSYTLKLPPHLRPKRAPTAGVGEQIAGLLQRIERLEGDVGALKRGAAASGTIVDGGEIPF